jgi:hypothetical protein
MSEAKRRLAAMIRAELAGLDWRISNGGKHLHLHIRDTMIAAIPCSSSENSRTWLRLRRDVRRYRRGGKS